MWNDKIEIDVATATSWLHVPVQVQHPWLLPEGIRQEYTVAFLQTGEPESLLHAAVREGATINVQELKLIQGALKFPLPGKKQGHGKDGRLVRRDYVESLVKFLFGDLPKEEQWKLVCKMVNGIEKHLSNKQTSKHAADILAAFEGLEKTDQKEFSELVAVHADELVLKERREQRARTEAPSKVPKQHETPLVLHDLHPAIAGCRITRHPALKRYQVFYVSDADEAKGYLAD